MAQVRPHTMAMTNATLNTIAQPGARWYWPAFSGASLTRAATIKASGEATCQDTESHEAVCSPAPGRPVGANTSGNVSIKGTKSRAENRNPLARTNNHVQRTIQNWANIKAA